jgi:hypothetical protein
MRALYYSIIWMGKLGDFAWKAGWGVWLLSVTWVMFAGGSIWIPFSTSVLTFQYGNLIAGLLMVFLGVPLGMSIVHFSSVVLRLPGAAVCVAIANKYQDGGFPEIPPRNLT